MKTIYLSKGEWKNKTSGVRGVSWQPGNNKWAAKYAVNGKKIHLGYFRTINEAANALLHARGVVSEPAKAKATVSDEDYEYLNQFNWTLKSWSGQKNKAACRQALVGDRRRTVLMSREVADRMGLLVAGNVVRHKDENSLNYCRDNIIVMTRSQHTRTNGSNGSLPRANTRQGVRSVD